MILWLGRWLVLDLVLTLAAGAAGIGLVREVVERRPLPAFVPPEPPSRPEAAVPDPAPGPRGGSAQYGVIAARNLFAASRGEASVAVSAPAGVKLVLHGVVIDAEQSRAYLDDPVAKRVFGYAVGDAVAGGRLEKILDDRVRIRRPEGVVEVLLQDPSKPQADAPAPVPTSGKARRAAARGAVPEPPSPASAAPPPGAEPVPPPSVEPPPPAVPGQVPR
jgi:hypothetical protein